MGRAKSSSKKPRARKPFKPITASFEELFAIMEDVVRKDRTPPSPIHWSRFSDDDEPDDE